MTNATGALPHHTLTKSEKNLPSSQAPVKAKSQRFAHTAVDVGTPCKQGRTVSVVACVGFWVLDLGFRAVAYFPQTRYHGSLNSQGHKCLVLGAFRVREFSA